MPALSDADLTRAVTPKPLALLGENDVTVSSAINGALSSAHGDHFSACDSFSAADLVDINTALYAVMHDGLNAIYSEAGDRRQLSVGSLEELEEVLAADLELASSRADLHDVVRDALCFDAAHWFVHHLGDDGKEEAKELFPALPLLPESIAPTPPNAEEDSEVAAAHDRLGASTVCYPCHYSSEDPKYTDDDGVDEDVEATDDAAPELRSWPDNVNYTIYAGVSGCCSADNNYTQIRHIDHRYDIDPPQQLEINWYSGGFGPEDKTCMLDECLDGHPEMQQFAQCHIFYNGSTVWEWYPQFQQCTKLIDGAGMPRGTWFKDFGMDVYIGEESFGDAPDVTTNRTCHKFCNSKDEEACMEQGMAYWIYDDGTPCKHHFPNGIDQYADFVETPELKGQTLSHMVPDYCPSWDSPALLPPEFPNQDQVCTGWWFNATEALEALK